MPELTITKPPPGEKVIQVGITAVFIRSGSRLIKLALDGEHGRTADGRLIKLLTETIELTDDQAAEIVPMIKGH